MCSRRGTHRGTRWLRGHRPAAGRWGAGFALAAGTGTGPKSLGEMASSSSSRGGQALSRVRSDLAGRDGVEVGVTGRDNERDSASQQDGEGGGSREAATERVLCGDGMPRPALAQHCWRRRLLLLLIQLLLLPLLLILLLLVLRLLLLPFLYFCQDWFKIDCGSIRD